MRMSEEFKRFNYLMGETTALYHDFAARAGLSDSVMWILYTICEQGDGCSQSEICRLCGMSRQTVNSAIRKLERGGLLYLEAGQGRNTGVFLTAAGRALAGETVLPLMALENEVLDGWTADERRALLRLTQKYLEDLQAKLSAGR